MRVTHMRVQLAILLIALAACGVGQAFAAAPEPPAGAPVTAVPAATTTTVPPTTTTLPPTTTTTAPPTTTTIPATTTTSVPVAEEHPVPPGSGLGRRIVYSNSGQRVWLIDADGTVVDTYSVSGRKGVPSPGTYEVFSKSETAHAGHDGITMAHMVRFARGRSLAIGFHAIPRDANGRPLQSEDDLGEYRSAGCVRQADHHAAFLYEWADIGTTVVVLP